ncbi:MAG: glycosyl transferase group 1 family protein [Sphingomonas bacterium]|nr:glycosyl transferase group 1 family protein [Sphingomonas bacterium]MDB5685039.1 glycosyl transferase group 1 family protein [Sphingomonas bacterium]
MRRCAASSIAAAARSILPLLDKSARAPHRPAMAPIRILHVHSTFSLGGKEARAVRLMNAWGDAAAHVVLSAVPGAMSARDAIAPGIAAEFPRNHPPLTGQPSPLRYRALAAYMRGFDLVLTYNWGAMDAVMARRLFGGAPLIHHEDGFNQDEAVRQKQARILFRRAALPAARALVVPSERLEAIAREIWRQPARRVHRIANGIPVDRFAQTQDPYAIPGFTARAERIVIGTAAGLRPVKNLPRLVRAFAACGPDTDLVIVGDGPEKVAIQREALELQVLRRLTLPGFLPDPARWIGLFDIFALSSESEQFPISVIEAMAAGLPIVSPNVGDVATMVSADNKPFITAPGDERALGEALRHLADNPALRGAIGAANRARARATFDEGGMIEAYRRLYWSAVDRAPAAGR